MSHNYPKEKPFLEYVGWIDVHKVGDMLLDSIQHQFELCQEEFATAHEGCNPGEHSSPRNNEPYQTYKELT